MNWLNSPSVEKDIEHNPFLQWPFWGRRRELQEIYKNLFSHSPQSCAVVGETFIGKTALLRYLASPSETSTSKHQSSKESLTFIYLDCAPYSSLTNSGNHASAQFWWGLYTKTRPILQSDETQSLNKSILHSDQAPIDIATEIKDKIEELIQKHQRPVIILLDNFEGVAGLPIRDSEWLRSIVQQNRCAYVVASRYLLYLSYHHHPERIVNPSPLWNLFSDPIYLGLITENEVKDFLVIASKEAKKQGSAWQQDDLDFLRNFAGRHPELLRIACVHLFGQRLQTHYTLQGSDHDFLEYRIAMDASPICDWLWHSLTDPELRGEVRSSSREENEIASLQLYQQALIDIAKGHAITEIARLKVLSVPEKEILLTLEQRGLIEQKNGKWIVFAEVMRQFVLKQEQKLRRSGSTESIRNSSMNDREAKNTGSFEDQGTAPAFTYLEEQVYSYLQAHAGKVCTREEIMHTVWRDDPPTNSALQKIIERIRAKIEPDTENPHYLISVRGQGYMLRDTFTASITV